MFFNKLILVDCNQIINYFLQYFRQPEEKSYVICEESQFTNLAIPWTEFYTAPDGSQQLLYCIQFDDVEQHGVDTFETTTATVRRQYSDFAQLHASLEEVKIVESYVKFCFDLPFFLSLFA